MNIQVYSGETAIREYLRPKVEDYSPLVELCSELNPYLTSHDIHIYVKLLNTLPLANVKSLPAWNMLEQMPHDLNGTSIVESSSGNTVLSLGLLAKCFGISKVKAIASTDVTMGKLNLLRIAGIDVQIVDGPMCPSPNDPKSSIAIAKSQGSENGWYNPGQYENTANPAAHMEYTGPQIYRQLKGNIALFVAGLGTTGTFVGTAQYLREKMKNIKTVGVVRSPNNPVPGVRTKNLLREVSFPWQNTLTDSLVVVNESDSFSQSLAMIRYGLLVGPSAGFALAGTLKHLDRMQSDGSIEQYRGKNVVFIAPDGMFPYVDEYFDVLDAAEFGSIDDQTTNSTREAAGNIGHVAELTTEDIIADYIYHDDEFMSAHYRIIDIRDERSYQDHHLPGSVHVPFDDIDGWLRLNKPTKPLVFVCSRGVLSLRAAKIAEVQGIQAYSMIGGVTEWSAKDLPRIKSPHC